MKWQDSCLDNLARIQPQPVLNDGAEAHVPRGVDNVKPDRGSERFAASVHGLELHRGVRV